MRSGRYLVLLLLLISFFIMPARSEDDSLQRIIQQAKEFKETGQVYFNFEKIDLKLLTYFISGLTGKNIVLSADIKGQISLIFPEPVSIDDAWNIYTSILKSRNYILVDKGSFYEVIPSGFSRNVTPPVKPELEESEDMVTYVYKFKNADVTQAVNVLRGLKSPKGLIFSYNPANIIIITDSQSNIKNLKQVISLIDTPSEGMEIKVYKLKYSSSGEIAAALTSLFSDLAKKGVQLKAYNLKSQNAVVVKAPSYVFKEIQDIISILDQPTPHPTYRRFWTIYLKNSKAEDIANVLNKLLENIRLVSLKEGAKKGKTQIKNLKTYTKPVSTQKTDRPKVVADKASNSIIIYANKTEYEAIKELVQNLDKQKKQVLVTALITEVSEQALKEIGVRWQVFGSQGGAAFRGGISKEGFYNIIGSTNFVAGVLSTSGENVEIGGNVLFFPDLLFLFSLLERGTGFNIVSSPKILTMDNIEASINVSQVTPFAQSVKFDINGNPIINYDYKEVGLILKVTPHISGDNIVMEIHQEVNEVIGYEKPQIGEISYVVPITSKRELNTTITVTNGKTIVLGGLVSKKTIKTMEGVPFFSSIPIIGNLFKYRSEDLNKTNLFVFLTPFIIEKPEDLARITEEHQKLSEALLKGKKKEEKAKEVEKKENKDIFENYRGYFGG
ncbi:MAG TPA: type II secretion system protein GspD [Persephonella sp.]|uniref:General secretion pathway protein D n=1 Tax=Persephonella marina (strain DSM 14350 / EX-H1) TaxID=123214 RepID=C0QPL4_PERMH|nr:MULTISPECIES: type II secretion system secretin GspD [Persephonella]ACO03516.1 general secretion pathway protein D [Persephonella marina EX-H1]HCB69775.1 type II secretion system protein GspD [Persephonella sp.]